MDARIVLHDIFGLRPGDVNVLSNAGAVATDDVVRSLAISHHVMGTTEFIVLGHTGCGLDHLDDDGLRQRIAQQSGQMSEISFGSFDDLDEHIRLQVERIRAHPWINTTEVHGMIYEVETGRVRAVAQA